MDFPTILSFLVNMLGMFSITDGLHCAYVPLRNYSLTHSLSVSFTAVQQKVHDS